MKKDFRQLDIFGPKPRVPSPLQRAIFDDIKHGEGHTAVIARAGSGKTTTIVDGLAYVPRGKSVAFFAFANATVDALASRAPEGVKVSTLHKHGVRTLGFHLGDFKILRDKTKILARQTFGPEIDLDPVRSYYDSLCDLLSRAKDTMKPAAAEPLDELLDRFGIDAPPDEVLHPTKCLRCREVIDPKRRKARCPSTGAHEFPAVEECVLQPDGTIDETTTPRRVFLAAAVRLLKLSESRLDLIDFGDMCWLPPRRKLYPPHQFDRVFVDEVQDLSPSQINFLTMTCKRGGRICVIGDPAQAIYAFRGADPQTMARLATFLSARELPLSVSYRCSRAVVKLARTLVPDIDAAEGNPEGRVVRTNEADLIANGMPGDFVISRANAPLLRLCIRFLRAGKAARVKGSDEFEQLRTFLEKFGIDDAAALRTALGDWIASERARLARRERSMDRVQDRYDLAVVVLSGHRTLAAALRAVAPAFVSDKAVEEGTLAPAVILATTHKLKGLESDRVWVLEETFRKDRGGEESNCWYVSVTRARDTVFLVGEQDEDDE